jgi:uncharacterized protein YlxP (DUF503 family)
VIAEIERGFRRDDQEIFGAIDGLILFPNSNCILADDTLDSLNFSGIIMDAESLAQIREIVGEATQSLRHEFQTSLAEAQRHTGVLIEQLHHKLDLVIEGQQFLRQQAQDIRSEIEHESQETRALLRLSYQQLQHRVESLEQRVQIIERHLGLSPG